MTEILHTGSELLVAGSFSHSGTAAVPRVARWIGDSWQAVGAGFDSGVRSLAIVNNQLFAGGGFRSSAATPASGVAALDGENWQPLGEGDLGDYVSASVVFQDELVMAGSFRTVGRHVTPGVGFWNGIAWRGPESGRNGTAVQPHALAVYHDQLVVGGRYLPPGSHGGVAILGDGGWEPLAIQNDVNSLTVFDGDLIAGGHFSNAGGLECRSIASWDGTFWHPLGEGILGEVWALQVWDGNLYAGGGFSMAGSTSTGGVARWDGHEWHSLDQGLNGYVRALTVYRDDLIAAGAFTRAGTLSTHRIARWDGADWHALGAGIHGTTPHIYALNAYGIDLYAAGFFSRAGDALASNIARWDGATWHACGAGTSRQIYTLSTYHGELIAGGDFELVDGDVSAYWARWGCPPVAGDMNCNTQVNVADIAGFVTALTDSATYEASFPTCNPLNGDFNGDAAITTGDIAGFVEMLIEG